MKNPTASKTDIYKAAGYIVFLMVLAFPASILGMQILNFALAAP
jgi:putative effector of murein hydrolase LrgA (UPF0299 family)